MGDLVEIEQYGAVSLIVLNRPEKRNALNAAMRQELRAAFDAFEEARDQRCAVLAANGPVFCAGGDLVEMAQSRTAEPPAEWSLLLGSRGRVDKPVIAAVQGQAVAGGFRIAQDCDLVVAADDATFGVTEVRRGRGAPWAVPTVGMIPTKVAAEILFTGTPISAARAYEIGLVNRVVPFGRLREVSLELAATIAANAPLSVVASKQMIAAAAEHGTTRAIEVANEIFAPVYRSRDAQEGPAAFAEGRVPHWQGR